MREQLTALLLVLILLVPIGLFAWQLVRVRRGTVSKLKAATLFFACSLIPVAVYVLLFFVFVGIEEVTGLSLVKEEEARSLAIVAGIGLAEVLVLTTLFAVAMLFVKVRAAD